MPERIQLSRSRGWRMPANTVKVDRSTRWGNPFIVGKDGTRAECIRLFKLLCGGSLCISRPRECVDAQEAFIEHAVANIKALRGKNLACWCPIGTPCHADFLLQIANPS